MIVAKGWDLARLLREIAPSLLALFAYDLVISVLYDVFQVKWVSIGDLPLPLLGSALGVFMGLRNTLAYNRWWEARTLWGTAGNNSRSLVRSLIMLAPDDPAVQAVAHAQIAWVQALRCQLRRQAPWDAIAPLLAPEALARVRHAANPVTAILAEQARILAGGVRAGRISGTRAVQFDRIMGELTNAQGGLERIRNTPMPNHFALFPRLFAIAYCLLLPIGLVANLGLLTPVGSTFLGFMFLALDRIGADLQDPFANTVHDVPMTALSRAVEIDLRQMLGETEVPPPVQPVDHALW